ncbi:MAG: hypothetical protein L0Y76_10140, partial [Ignavibacteria bacterium]|nr:hypothetical protein [Ignavibacteria bacterium]
MFPSGDAENDRITIMLGDGSTEVLENVQNQTDIGIYKSKAKGSYLKAKVVKENQTEYYRTMYLMKGDGLTYIFKEYYNSYTDVISQQVPLEWYKPKAFYLTEIADRFGNTISLDYIGITGKNIGRKWLNSINGSDITVSYASVYDQYTGMKITTIDGNFRFSTSTFGVGAPDDHRPRLLSILNPTGETTSFGYASYVREATDLAYTSESQMKISMGGNGSPGLNRLSRIDGFDGSVRLYDYVPTLEYSISFQQEGPEKPHSSHSYYKGYGRDLFFSNMISSAVINNGTNDIRRIDYIYEYEYHDREDVFSDPIDTTDNCITTKTVTSLDTTYDYDTPQTNKTKKYYKIYNTNPQFSGEYLEYNGTIRLIRDFYYTDNEENPFKLVYNDYYMGYNNVYFEGSFLDKSVTETITGVSRTAQYGYDINSTTGLIETKHETDPFGRVTTTDYVSFYLEDYEVFKEGKFIVAGSVQEYSDIYFYLIHQPSEINVIKDNTLLKKTEFDYYNPSSVVTPQSVVQGYPGQLKEQKEYDPSANTVLRSANYVYYNQDTTGKHMKPSSFFCTNEGNLKEITDANGNKTKYYYHVISRTEEEGFNPDCNNTDEENCPYRVSYHVFNDDGTVDIGKSNWQDSRLPSRFDGYYSPDKFITNYNLYNKIGNPLKIVSPNRCLSDVTYQNYYRLGVITLPYDFSDTPPDI